MANIFEPLELLSEQWTGMNHYDVLSSGIGWALLTFVLTKGNISGVVLFLVCCGVTSDFGPVQ